jgi:hypothetical protein
MIGRRFVDEGKEYVVMKAGHRQWKRSMREVANYSEPDNVNNRE